MSRSRLLAALAVPFAAIIVAGCTVGPEVGPTVVRGDDGAAEHTPEPDAPPALGAPKKELDWQSCGNELADTYPGVSTPKGVTIECAQIETPIDASKGDSRDIVRTRVIRATTAKTPKKAAPLVLTSGSDVPSSRALLALLSGSGATLVDGHPVVSVDRRGTGLSSPLDCLSSAQRTDLLNAAGNGSVQSRLTDLTKAARGGADLCTETLTPYQLNYSATDAANDLESLRSAWDIDHLALWGLGEGSSVVLAYAANHPEHVGRLLLDSPVGYGTASKKAAQDRAAGLQATLAAAAQQCIAPDCAPGADLTKTFDALLGGDDNRSRFSSTDVLAAVTTMLAFPSSTDGPDIAAIARTLTDAQAGKTTALAEAVSQANTLRDSDGQLVSRCNDLLAKPGTSEIPGLVTEWSKTSPLTATPAALGLARCDGWGVADDPTELKNVDIAPLILVGRNDPINGGTAALSLAPVLTKAGIQAKSVSWEGLGFSVLARSDCAAAIVDTYLGDQQLTGPTDRACPA